MRDPKAERKPSNDVDFNDYRDSYREAVQESISFQGTDLEFFSRAKARRLLELAESRLGAVEGLDVLDVGCGAGETDRVLEGRFGRLAGTDIAHELVARAAEVNPWAEYRPYAAGEPLPFEDESFDLSFAICVLHHVPVDERARFVAEMARVTREQGVVAIFEHNPWNPLTRRSVSNCEFDEGVVLLSRRTAGRLLDEQGLDRVEGAYIIFFTRGGPRLHRVERSLAWVPAGAQYYVAARKSAPTLIQTGPVDDGA